MTARRRWATFAGLWLAAASVTACGDDTAANTDPKLGKVYLADDGTVADSGSYYKVCEWRNLVYNRAGKIAVSQFDPQCDPAVRR